MAGTWTVDPAILSNLREREARRALVDERLDEALIEAEELLDEDPDNPTGLEISGLAALQMGDVMMALQALDRLVSLHSTDARILQALAVARFEAIEYRGALNAAEQATMKDPTLAAGWFYQGLALERLGNATAADERFRTAAEYDGEQFPVPERNADLAWDELLQAGLEKVPESIRDFFNGVPIVFEEYPAVEELIEHYPPISPFRDALYRGQAPVEADPWKTRPRQIMLYTGNLSRPTPAPNLIEDRIADALMHEAMHWLGLSHLPG